MWLWSRFINSNLFNKKNMKSTNLTKKIVTIIEKETDKKIDINKNFIENSMDSLDMISIVMGIEKKFKLKIPDKKLKSLKNINDLKKLIEEK